MFQKVSVMLKQFSTSDLSKSLVVCIVLLVDLGDLNPCSDVHTGKQGGKKSNNNNAAIC